MGTPAAAFLVTLAILVGLAFAVERPGDSGGDRAGRPALAIAVAARRVERLRGLRFEEVPRPVRVSPERARREGLADLDRSYPAARRSADEAMYELLGLLPAGTDLRDVSASVFGEQVAGYYEPRTGRLRVVEAAGAADPVLAELTLAHELVHALEDQALGFDLGLADSTGDGGLAYGALLEGTATAVMADYADRHLGAEDLLGGLLGSAPAASSAAELPPFVTASLLFPYTEGARFVADLRRRPGWRLVDTAFARPPASTEQVVHPEAWLRVDRPERVRVRPPAGAGWRRLASGTFGEWQTAELLATAGTRRPQSAAGWEGDVYALWRRPGGHALRIRWRYETPEDVRELAEALRDVVRNGELRAPALVKKRGRTVTLSIVEG